VTLQTSARHPWHPRWRGAEPLGARVYRDDYGARSRTECSVVGEVSGRIVGAETDLEGLGGGGINRAAEGLGDPLASWRGEVDEFPVHDCYQAAAGVLIADTELAADCRAGRASENYGSCNHAPRGGVGEELAVGARYPLPRTGAAGD